VCSPSSSASPLLPLPIPPITRTYQVYRVEFSFRSRSAGHLEVTEGETVRLEQNFDNGWVSHPRHITLRLLFPPQRPDLTTI
jgi:hypothetical protein